MLLTAYVPKGPGGKKHSLYVTFFFERQGWCGLGNEDIKVLSTGTFHNWVSNV